jgi:ATP synthase protein I
MIALKGLRERHLVPITLLAQAGTTLSVAVLVGFWEGWVAAYSLLLGGLTAVAPNAFLAARLLGARADAVMRSAWLGEIGKLLLTVLLFAAIFGFVRPYSAPAVFGGFIAAQLAVLGTLLLGSTTTPASDRTNRMIDGDATTKS